MRMLGNPKAPVKNVPVRITIYTTNVGAMLYMKRTKLGMTGVSIAKECGVSATAYWSWEKGNRFPNRSNMQRLAEVLDIPLKRLVDAYVDDYMNSLGDVPLRGSLGHFHEPEEAMRKEWK